MGMTTMNTPRAIVSSRCAAWDGIRVEHYQLQAGELPEHSHREHLILIPLGEGCAGEIRTAQGRITRGVEMSGSVCVIPSRHSFAAELEVNLNTWSFIWIPRLSPGLPARRIHPSKFWKGVCRLIL